MARTRARAKAAAPAAAPENADLDQQPEDKPGIHITEADFSGPGVIDMAKEEDGIPGDGDAEAAAADSGDEPAPAALNIDDLPAPERPIGPLARVRLVGFKANRRQPPYGVTLIVPADGKHDPDAVVTKGETVNLVRGRTRTVSAKAAKWLTSHPVYRIEKVG